MSLRYSDGDIGTRLLPDVELAVYRVVQEALTNAGRHSGATGAEVSVVEAGGLVRVEVRDNGRRARRRPLGRLRRPGHARARPAGRRAIRGGAVLSCLSYRWSCYKLFRR